MQKKQRRFDEEITDLIPHRPPMLLINRLESVDSATSSAIVLIDEKTPFFEKTHGVPSWIGLEYMGQTAALIAGYQAQIGKLKDHLGYLIGARQYRVKQSYFMPNLPLLIRCQQAALVGESLVKFDCTITDISNNKEIANATLSVFRQLL